MKSTNMHHLNLYNYLLNRDYKPLLLNQYDNTSIQCDYL